MAKRLSVDARGKGSVTKMVERIRGVTVMEDWPDFHEVDWRDLYPRLVIWTKGRVRRVYWRGQRGGHLPKGLQAEDFIQTALEEAQRGARPYNSSKTLFENLCQIISGKVSNATSSYENKYVSNDDDKVVRLEDFKDTPEQAAQKEQLKAKFLDYLGRTDGMAKRLAEQVYVGRTGSLELSVELKLPVKEIENIKKRLRRLAEAFRQAYLAAPSTTQTNSVKGQL